MDTSDSLPARLAGKRGLITGTASGQVEVAAERLGGIDGPYNNAAGFGSSPFEELLGNYSVM
ncbi:hypothetical protein [Rhodococcus sp. NCIMB 12038]|uniref:hypothetical protein n=1 Tax=Rhodococcus sp. NCIMB 12038 TaxID=933800 RepID=UPI00211B530E|nr:hypothetical protein [Rhodococcus sp. NCIMB 12038]